MHPEIPEEGLLLEQLFAGNIVGIQEKLMSIKKVAADLGLAFGDHKKVYSSRLAQELRYWAESKNRAEPFNQAVFKAYFADGKNIGKKPVLIDIAVSAGLPEREAEKVIETREFKDVVDTDWAFSRETGILAVPTFVINKNSLVGAQSYEHLKNFMDANSVSKFKKPVD